MSYQADLARLIKAAQRQGFRTQRTSSGHWQFYSPNKKDIVTVSGTPGDRHAWNNNLAMLKRAGYREEGRATTSLGDALQAAKEAAAAAPEAEPDVIEPLAVVVQQPPSEEPAERQFDFVRIGIHNIILHELEVNPGGLSTEELIQRVKVQRPDLGNPQVSTHKAIQKLRERGTVEGGGHARYLVRLRAQLPPGVSASATTQASSVPLSSDAAEDIRALDEAIEAFSAADQTIRQQLDVALGAFARLDGIFRRIRPILIKAAELKTLLDALNQR